MEPLTRRHLSRRALGIGALTAVAGAVTATVLLEGDDIDQTGEQDSTAGIQQRLDEAGDGAVVAIPAGAVLRCTSTITLSGAGASLVGPGELRFTDGVADKPGVLVTGTGCRVASLTVTNPGELFTRTGPGQTAGILIAADDVVVADCLVDRFGYGIVVDYEGEWVDIRILGNRVRNVLGAGGGRGSDSDDGEDRGDGITVWGARATVSGNVVSAKAGTDARIGIHAEGLSDQEQHAVAGADALVTFTGNVVTGPFRRGLVFEAIDNGVITGNVVADATWWGIALIDGAGSVVADNVVRYTRTADDDQGSSYSPPRSALLVFGGTGHRVAGNTVTVPGVADAFITLSTLEDVLPTDVQNAGNNCRTAGSGTCAQGVTLLGDQGPVRPKIVGNTVVGASEESVFLGGSTAPEVSGNTIVGSGGTAVGILGGSPRNDGALVVGNRITGCATGIALAGQSAAVVSANLVDQCGTGLDLSGSAGAVVTGNVLRTTGTALVGAAGNDVLP